jgi:hypothetical protein
VTPAQIGTGILDAIYATFGPFLVPAVIFVVGLVGYALLLLLTRAGVLDGGRDG